MQVCLDGGTHSFSDGQCTRCGKAACPACGGVGVELCHVCNGNGLGCCTACSGSGYSLVPCQTCSGDGCEVLGHSDGQP